MLAATMAAKGNDEQPLVGIVMGSTSDWPTMQHAATVLAEMDVSHETRVVSAHRTPDLLREYATTASNRGLKAIIAGAGGAAHLPGMLASWTLLPVLGVPVKSRALNGVDSLLSIVQMPGGVPVGSLAIGDSGARNAGLLAVRMLVACGVGGEALRAQLTAFHQQQTERVLASELPPVDDGTGSQG